ncbi:MDR family MFS transporter [Vibrio palustris]|uniref:Multidrug resistance protein 3 n=1 Tax=Vibrio palustris TaxID=1918946 RepID=A0A1R4AZW0_9VIBR|nr:MDR family MFS transporter [Vibrio palustris]SJL82202.1 Multidrug resistance protein 3 [Vibrio palustris]
MSNVDKKVFLRIFATVFLPMFLAAVDQTLLATATPDIVRDIGDMQLASWIVIGYMLTGAATIPIYGWLGDQFGRRNILIVALGIFAMGSVFCALSSTMFQLVMGRILQGIGSGGLMSLSQALIGEVVPPRQRARFQGYFSAFFALSSISGPVLGGLVVTYLSWQWLFWFNLPLIALGVYRLSRMKTVALPEKRRSIDAYGLMLFPILTAVIIYWLSSGGHYFAWGSVTSIALISTFLVTFGIFIWQQKRTQDSFLPLHLLVKKEIHRPLLSGFMFAACLFLLAFFLPIFLQVALHLNAAAAGVHMIPLSGGVICGAYTTGKLISRYGVPKYIPVIGMSFTAVNFLLLGTLAPTPTLVSGLAFLCGCGLGTVMPSTQLTIQTIAGKQHLGRITAMGGLCRSLGGSVGTAMFGTLIYSLIPGFGVSSSIDVLVNAPHGVVVEAFQWGFKAAALLAAVCAFNAFCVPRIHLDDYTFDETKP